MLENARTELPPRPLADLVQHVPMWGKVRLTEILCLTCCCCIDTHSYRPPSPQNKRNKSDNIPGVSGIGPKTLINKLDFLQSDDDLTLDTLFEKVAQMDDEKLKNKILENTDTLKLNYDLMQLSEPIMGAAITSNVRNIINSPINRLN